MPDTDKPFTSKRSIVKHIKSYDGPVGAVGRALLRVVKGR